MRIFISWVLVLQIFGGGPAMSWAQSGAAIETRALEATKSSSDYRIRPGDILQVSVYPQAELSGSLVVFEDGTVQIPTVGRILVSGQTRDDCVKTLEERFAKFFVKPRITLSVVKYSERNIIVGGEVRIPGIVPFVEGMTVSEAVARAGGAAMDSDRKAVRVFRGAGGKREVKIVDLDGFLNGRAGALDPKVVMGDLIEVPRLINAVFVWGEVKTPGRYDYFTGMTMSELIARAQGLTYAAKRESIRIFHADGTMVDVDFGKVLRGEPETNAPLLPGDIVVVPDRSFARWSYWVNLTTPYFLIAEFILTIIIVSKTGL